MKARTIEELARFLRDDLAWRRKENRTLQSAVNGAEAAKRQALLRGAIASLYAHWEGFVKTACRAYVEFVGTRRLHHHELSIPFLGLAIRHRLRAVDNSPRLDSHLDFAEWLLREWLARARFPEADGLIGTSNLDSHVFRGFITGLGLPYPPDFQRAEKPVIDVLVHLRNNLAHGAWQVVDKAQYDELLIWIDRLMQLVCELVEDAAATSAYRRQNPQLT